MTARVDQLEADVRKAVRLGWATFGCSLVSLALKLIPVAHPEPAPAPPPAAAPQASGNTVTIGAAADPVPDRDYQTVAEFAAANGMATRTVLSHIAAGRLSPAPVKDGREWILPRHCRLQPQLAADGGNQPQE